MTLVLVYLAFISLGLPDGLLGVAWPGMVRTHHLTLDDIGPMLVCSTVGYTLASLSSGPLLRHIGIGVLLGSSCLATALALFVYGMSPYWLSLVAIALVLGLGAGAIDSGLNTYVAQRHNQRTMQWMHASFGIGVTAGPLVMTAAIASTGTWQVGYLWVALAQLLLGGLFFFTTSQWSQPLQREHHSQAGTTLLATTLLPNALLGALLFFLYTGIELGVGLWIYTFLVEARQIEPAVAGTATAAYWGMFTFGRVLAGLFGHRIGNHTLVNAGLLIAFFSVILLMWVDGRLLTVMAVMLTGLGIAPIFPALTSGTVHRVQRLHEANAIGLQMAAASLGAALLPAAAGWLAQRFGPEVIPLYVVVAIGLLLLGHLVSSRLQTGAGDKLVS